MINKNSKQNENYYNKNREKVRKQQEKYRSENKEFYNTSVYNSRKNKSNMLKAKGQIYTFLPDEERYNAMALSLAKKLKIPTKKARKILEKNNFNYRKVIDEEYY